MAQVCAEEKQTEERPRPRAPAHLWGQAGVTWSLLHLPIPKPEGRSAHQRLRSAANTTPATWRHLVRVSSQLQEGSAGGAHASRIPTRDWVSLVPLGGLLGTERTPERPDHRGAPAREARRPLSGDRVPSSQQGSGDEVCTSHRPHRDLCSNFPTCQKPPSWKGRPSTTVTGQGWNEAGGASTDAQQDPSTTPRGVLNPMEVPAAPPSPLLARKGVWEPRVRETSARG